MSEPMVSHDCVAFYLLSQEVAKHVKVVQSGQGADEVFARLPLVPAAGEPRRRPRDGARGVRDGVLRPGHRRRWHGLLTRRGCADGDPSGQFVTAALRRAGRADRASTGPAARHHVMLVDDPVKRVDNMTMAWGLEARVPFLDHDSSSWPRAARRS